MNINYKIRQKIADFKTLLRLSSYYFEYLMWSVFSPNKFKLPPKTIKNVLIVNYGALGDIFCSLRILNNLIAQNPEKKFSILVPEENYESINKFERYLDFNLIRKDDIKNKKFDITLFFTLVPELERFKNNLGFCVGNEYHSITSSIKFYEGIVLDKKVSPKFRHKLKQEIAICQAAGLKIDEKVIPFRKINLKIHYKKKMKNFVILHPSGRNFSKIVRTGRVPALAWPFERFSEVGDYVISKFGYNILITGTEEEKFIADKVISSAKNKKNFVNLSGKLDVEELTYLVSLAKGVITIDTSIVHIAEFTGTPVVALFGPTFPEEVGAYGDKKKQINIYHKEYCIRDRKKGSAYDRDNICMKSISVEEVKKAINEVLK